MSSPREAHMRRFSPWGPKLRKIQIRPEKFILAWTHSPREAHMRRFSPWDRSSEKFRLGWKNKFLHEVTSGSAYGPIFPLRVKFQKQSDSAGKIHFGMSSRREADMHRFSVLWPKFKKNWDSAGKKSFWHELTSGSACAPILSLRTKFLKIQIQPEKLIVPWAHVGKRICTDFLLEERISKNFDLAVKIHLAMMSRQDALLRGFGPLA